MDLFVTEWRAVVGFEGIYEVSEFGDVRRIGKNTGAKVGRILKKSRLPRGYVFYMLCSNCQYKNMYAHVAVAASFIGPRHCKYEINHKDSDKENNHVSNLEYVTVSENGLHRDANTPRGRRRIELTPQVKALAAQGLTQKEIGIRVGLGEFVVHCIINNLRGRYKRRAIREAEKC